MTNENLGMQAIKRIADLYQISKEDCIWHERGFDWWPGDHKVSIYYETDKDLDNENVFRLVFQTAFIKNLSLPVKAKLIESISSFAPSYGYVYPSEELIKHHQNLDDKEQLNINLWFKSIAYLRDDTANWLPEFFGRMALLQPVDAQRMSKLDADLLGGIPDISSLNEIKKSQDEILNVPQGIYILAGKDSSKWIDTGEFEEIVQRFGKSDLCFGNGDSSGLTLETPFGDNSALIRLFTDIPHPALGNGLLSTIQLPFWESIDQVGDVCAHLNFLNSIDWTNVPYLGSWFPKQVKDDIYCPAYSSFIPNALYETNLAANMALWCVAGAQYAKEKVWPSIKNVTMNEIYRKRFQKD
jgi:hypothetical protein